MHIAHYTVLFPNQGGYYNSLKILQALMLPSGRLEQYQPDTWFCYAPDCGRLVQCYEFLLALVVRKKEIGRAHV